MPYRFAIIGAAGGLGSAIVRYATSKGYEVVAIVRSKPERIGNLPENSRVAVIDSLADTQALQQAFRGCSAVITATGVTGSSNDKSSLLSEHLDNIENAMLEAGTDRIVMVNTIVAPKPGQKVGWMPSLMGVFALLSWMPGNIGIGASDMLRVVDRVGGGALSKVKWTLVRAGVNSKGYDVDPVACDDWSEARNSMNPVSYDRMAKWMVDEAIANNYVSKAPLVSKSK